MFFCYSIAYKVGYKNTKKHTVKQKKQVKISLFTSILLISQSKSVIIIYIKIMEIEGKIIVVLPAREGVSSRGTQWKSQDYVIETHEQYPRKCCFNVFGSDKIDLFNIQSGEELRVSFDIDAHEYQGRWFNSIRAWKVERIDANAAQQVPPTVPFPDAAAAQPAQTAAPQAQPASNEAFPPAQEGGSEDDLPF